LSLNIRDSRNRLERLTDALLSEVIDKSAFLEAKNGLVAKEVELKQTLANLEVAEYESLTQFEVAIAMVQNARLTLQYSPYERKREILQTVIEKMKVNGKSVTTTLHESFETILRHNLNNPRVSK
jgi:hypothetical protein